MSSPGLNRLLRNLNADPGLLAELEANPDSVLNGIALSDEERSLMRSPDRYRLLQSLGRDAASNPSF